MPPKVKRRRSRKNGVVQDIIERLPHGERQGIINDNLQSQVGEMLRVLGVKVPMGRLDKQDSIETRAAVVLEYVLRKEQSRRLAVKTLASAVGMRPAAFEVLQTKIGNYLADNHTTRTNPTRVGSQASRTNKSLAASSKPLARNQISSRPLRSNAVWKSTIPTLSIKLGALVHDSHGFARQAEQLLQDLHRHVQSLSVHERHGYSSDMTQHREAYEAACFYVVVQRRQGSQPKARSSAATIATNELEMETDRLLEKQDVLNASSVLKPRFEEVLRAVEKLSASLEEKKGKVSEKVPPKKKQSAPVPARKRSGPLAGVESDVVESSGIRSLLKRLEDAENGEAHEDALPEAPVRIPHVFSDAFVSWKNQILGEAREEARQALRADSRTLQADSISDAEAIKLAAEAILERNQLLD